MSLKEAERIVEQLEQYVPGGRERRREKAVEIFEELIVNASKAMPKGGKITITGEKSNLNMLAIYITDTGHGIARRNLKKIFDYGYTSWEKAKGTGDGLSLVKLVLEYDHEGKMSVKSVPKKGATFTVELPIFKK